MKFYTLDANADTTGFFPQDNGLIGNCHVDSPNHLWKFAKNAETEGLCVPHAMKLRHQAKFTDILWASEITFPYLIITERFLRLMLKLNLPDHLVFPLNVTKREKLFQYYLFISKRYFAEYIDFKNSAFFVSDHVTKEFIDIKNTEDFWGIYHRMNESNYLSAKNFKINAEVIEYDFFRLPMGLPLANYIVSETFVEYVKKKGLTGMSFTPFEGK